MSCVILIHENVYPKGEDFNESRIYKNAWLRK